MKLDINEIHHNYIVKIVIFGVFLYKRFFRQPNIYKAAVIRFVNRRVAWKINLIIDTGIKLDKEDEREIILQEILNNIESDFTTIVTVTFTTPLKKTTISINLKDEEKYTNFLYS